MHWWSWFLIGAGVGLLHIFVKPLSLLEFLQAPALNKLQVAVFLAVAGAVIYGTVLWLLLGVVFHI